MERTVRSVLEVLDRVVDAVGAWVRGGAGTIDPLRPSTWSNGFWVLVFAFAALVLLALLRRRGRRPGPRAPELLVTRGELMPDPSALRTGAGTLTMTVSNLSRYPVQVLEVAVLTGSGRRFGMAEVSALVPAMGEVDLEVRLPVGRLEDGVLDVYAYAAATRVKSYRHRAELLWEPWAKRFKVAPLEQRITPTRALISARQDVLRLVEESEPPSEGWATAATPVLPPTASAARGRGARFPDGTLLAGEAERDRPPGATRRPSRGGDAVGPGRPAGARERPGGGQRPEPANRSQPARGPEGAHRPEGAHPTEVVRAERATPDVDAARPERAVPRDEAGARRSLEPGPDQLFAMLEDRAPTTAGQMRATPAQVLALNELLVTDGEVERLSEERERPAQPDAEERGAGAPHPVAQPQRATAATLPGPVSGAEARAGRLPGREARQAPGPGRRETQTVRTRPAADADAHERGRLAPSVGPRESSRPAPRETPHDAPAGTRDTPARTGDPAARTRDAEREAARGAAGGVMRGATRETRDDDGDDQEPLAPRRVRREEPLEFPDDF